jgi:integrase
MHLTEITIRNLKPADRQRTYFDEGLAGFGLRVSPGGTKAFVLMHGKSRQLTTLGRYGIISLAQARAKAKEILAERTLGNHRAPTITFEEAYELFKTSHCAQKKNRTAKSYQRIIEKHFLPKLRLERLEEISTHVLAGITDKLLPTPSELAHAQAVSRTLFRWAVRRRYLRHNPLEGLQLAKPVARDRVLSEEELAGVYRGAEDYPFGTIVRLLILTGQRRGEISFLRWEYIDEKKRTMTLPASLTKNNRQHTFPYGKLTQEVLKTVPRLGEYVFPARGNSGASFSGWSNCKSALDKKCKIAPWTLHDLRRTYSTVHASIGTPPHVTERLLNHVSGTISGVAAIYNRYAYLDEMRAAVAAFEKHLGALSSAARSLVPGERRDAPFHEVVSDDTVSW